MNNFYTYVIRDPRTFEPIYVGKGNNGRMFDHWEYMLRGQVTKNKKLYNKLTAIFREGYTYPIYEKWLENADETLAFWMERFLVKSIGRDSLCNLTDGGEGQSGLKHSEETRQKMRDKIMSKEARQKIGDRCRGEKHYMFGKHRSKEIRQRISDGKRGKCSGEKNHFFGKHLSEEARKKIGDANRGRQSQFFGKTHSAESHQKMRESALKRHAARRAHLLNDLQK